MVAVIGDVLKRNLNVRLKVQDGFEHVTIGGRGGTDWNSIVVK